MSPEDLTEAREFKFCRELSDKITSCKAESIIEDLLAHINSQAEQIAALKEIAIGERAKIVFHDQMMPMMSINNWGTVPDDDFEIKVGNCMLPVRGRKYWISEARKQLEAEYEAMRT